MLASSQVDDQEKVQGTDYTIVKGIILDDDRFWRDMVAILRVSLPVVKLLKLIDDYKPVLGKVYPTMSAVEQKLQRMIGVSRLPEVR